MDIEELVIGTKKADLSELKELKVKLPVRLLVNLHYVKLTQSRGISDVVNEALTQYFEEMVGARMRTTVRVAPISEAILEPHVEAAIAALAPSVFRA